MSTVTFAIRQGPRKYQEDRHSITRLDNTRYLIAVMDGHGGSIVSSFCQKNIEHFLPVKVKPRAVLRGLIENLNSQIRYHCEGSTFSAVIISKNTATVAILGDSPVVVLDENGKIHISPEHNVRSNISEREATIRRGGVYDERGFIGKWKNSFGLQLSRALGDISLEGIVSRKPKIYTIKNPRWILVASDGLFDPSHENTKQLLKEVEEYAKNNANAETLMKWAEKRGLEDNATAVVWRK